MNTINFSNENKLWKEVCDTKRICSQVCTKIQKKINFQRQFIQFLRFFCEKELSLRFGDLYGNIKREEKDKNRIEMGREK